MVFGWLWISEKLCFSVKEICSFIREEVLGVFSVQLRANLKDCKRRLQALLQRAFLSLRVSLPSCAVHYNRRGFRKWGALWGMMMALGRKHQGNGLFWVPRWSGTHGWKVNPLAHSSWQKVSWPGRQDIASDSVTDRWWSLPSFPYPQSLLVGRGGILSNLNKSKVEAMPRMHKYV